VRGIWRIELGERAEHDFERLTDHLAESYEAFGQERQHARRRALQRAQQLRLLLHKLRYTPHRGTRHDSLLTGLRSTTFEELAIWFRIEEDAGTVRVLAVFFSGQDQHARMLARLSPQG
jgi:toxin ParE1/3/4